MTRRMLDSAIWKNEKFGVMPSMARLLAIGIINEADDQGRGKAHPVYLRSQIFPYDDVTAGEVASWLKMIASNETILLYQVDGKDYYQVLNWWTYQSHQYAMPSQYPKPDGWHDRIRKTITPGTIATCNWITKAGTCLPDTCDEQGILIETIVSPDVSPDLSSDTSLDDDTNQSPEGTRLRLSLDSNLSSSSKTSSRSSSKTNGADALIDPDLAKALALWKETFAGTPWEGTPPIASLPKWLDYYGSDVLCYMIGKAKDKDNPGGWLYTTYDNWRNAGEVAPYVTKAINDAKKTVKRKPVTHIVNPFTGEKEAVTQ